jgi:hypothetical protein
MFNQEFNCQNIFERESSKIANIYVFPIKNRVRLSNFHIDWQCNTNIFDYLNIWILGGEYFIFEYKYLFSSVQRYLISVFGQIDLMNIYSVHIWYGSGGYSAYIQYIFEYKAPNIHYSNMNVLFRWNKYLRYSYSVKI